MHQRLSQETIDRIKTLTLGGVSLRELSRETGLGITTIYYQVRKFKPKQKKEFCMIRDDFTIGELTGAFAGDGSYFSGPIDRKDPKRGTCHRVRYHLSLKTDRAYAEHLKSLLNRFNVNPWFVIREKESLIDVTLSSKPFISLMKENLTWETDKTHTIRLKREISAYSDDFLRGFARGLMDTDGFLNPGNAVCACISEKLIDNLAEIFMRFNMILTRRRLERDGNRRPLFYVRVSRTSLETYRKCIGFSNDYKAAALRRILEKI